MNVSYPGSSQESYKIKIRCLAIRTVWGCINLRISFYIEDNPLTLKLREWKKKGKKFEFECEFGGKEFEPARKSPFGQV